MYLVLSFFLLFLFSFHFKAVVFYCSFLYFYCCIFIVVFYCFLLFFIVLHVAFVFRDDLSLIVFWELFIYVFIQQTLCTQI